MKKWYQSKTVWLGILMVVGAIFEYIAKLPIDATLAQAVSGVLVIIVRFLTNQPLDGGTQPPVTPPTTPPTT